MGSDSVAPQRSRDGFCRRPYGLSSRGRPPIPNERWLAARDEVLALDQTHITYAEFAAVCGQHGLDETETKTLIGLLHTLGYIIFYDSDGLRDFVVLKPEWLTKAIGYILEDKITRHKLGILDHRRLKAIWHEHGHEKRETYPPPYFPYFLRLMEQYDVSARLEGADASLIPQMVPYERPSLPWAEAVLAGQGQLSLVCEMDQNPPGLIAWTTVRNHRWSTGLHWRNGVFLRHKDGHEALVDVRTRTLACNHLPSHFIPCSIQFDFADWRVERVPQNLFDALGCFFGRIIHDLSTFGVSKLVLTGHAV